MNKIPFGPTYEEMLHPEKADKTIRTKALAAKTADELDPINLFNITWKNEKNKVNKIVLPKALTGIDANVVVL
ncbi:MAG: pyridoxal-5'-phosphate-dependent protein subunit beta, partial [Bacillota bacterium]|nr:pyridoxal-5'-phosphate-dependent protein subunit beta [Bacillota bacterium]